MKKRVFIHGAAGTTGLRIHDRLQARDDLTLVILPEEKRKDPEAVAEALNESDIAFFCLPDDAAREAAAMVRNPDTVVLDASTAHRTDPDWVYGFPELSPENRRLISGSRRIAVPGCHASGFIALAAPLVQEGILPKTLKLTCFSLTGYTGGGKKMIAEYESEGRSPLLDAPRMYGLGQRHKHLPEMKKMAGLEKTPLFCPIVADFPAGMEVVIPLDRDQLPGGEEDIRRIYAGRYTGPVVRYREQADEEGFLSAAALAGRDSMEISVHGNGREILLTARFDNLGKGASGAAVQCMNLALGLPEETGLNL